MCGSLYQDYKKEYRCTKEKKLQIKLYSKWFELKSCPSFYLTFAEGEDLQEAVALSDAQSRESVHVALDSFLQFHQSIHYDILHLVCSFLLRLALQTYSLDLYLGVAVLFSIMVAFLLEFVHLAQEQLVLTLEVAVFVLEDALDVCVILKLIGLHAGLRI